MNEMKQGSNDEMQLMDYLGVMWKWKVLIVVGTLCCGAAAVLISFKMPKIYRTSMIIELGVVTTDRGKDVYIDTPQNLKAIILSGAFDKEILGNVGRSGKVSARSLKFEVTPVKKAENLVEVSYETRDIEMGLQVLNQLGELLSKRYDEKVKYFRSEYQTEIDLAQNELAEIEAEERTSEARGKSYAARIDEMRSEIMSLRKNMASLIKKRDKLLSNGKNETTITSAILCANTIQQNIALENSYRLEINDYTTWQEVEKLRMESLDTREEGLMQRIENAKAKMSAVQNIGILRSPFGNRNPIKPRTRLNVMLGFVGGAFLMIFASFFLEYIQRQRSQSK